MDSTRGGRNSVRVVLIGYPDLAAKGPEGTRHHVWIFNCAGLVVLIADEPDIGDSSGPVHRPHAAAAFTCHDHVEGKLAQCALMIKGNPGMVRRAACVWDDRKQCGGIG